MSTPLSHGGHVTSASRGGRPDGTTVYPTPTPLRCVPWLSPADRVGELSINGIPVQTPAGFAYHRSHRLGPVPASCFLPDQVEHLAAHIAQLDQLGDHAVAGDELAVGEVHTGRRTALSLDVAPFAAAVSAASQFGAEPTQVL